jgi:hypothetical protein
MSSDMIEPGVNPETWSSFLKSVAEGASPTEAMQRHLILWREVELIVLSSQIESKRWREARLMSKASRWSLSNRDEVFERLGAAGAEPERVIAEVLGGENIERDVADFYELCEAIPEWQERYAAVMRARGLREEQQDLEIADDTSRDVLDTGGKAGRIPNGAAVQRDKLRVDVRRSQRAAWNPERWGERRNNVQVNIEVNHAAALEAARDRVTQARRRFSKEDKEGAADAVYTQAPAAALTKDAEPARAVVPKRKPPEQPDDPPPTPTPPRTPPRKPAPASAMEPGAPAAAETAWVYEGDDKPVEAAAEADDKPAEKDSAPGGAEISTIWREER